MPEIVVASVFPIAQLVNRRVLLSSRPVIEIAGLVCGVIAVRMARSRPTLVMVAAFAQAADLVSFGFVGPEGEANPLARVVHVYWLNAVGDLPLGLTAWLGAVVMMGLKLGLVAYLIWAAPHLGRYRTLVLAAAAILGMLGAISNLLATPLLLS